MAKSLDFEEKNYSLIEQYEEELRETYQEEEYLIDEGFHIIRDGMEQNWNEIFFL